MPRRTPRWFLTLLAGAAVLFLATTACGGGGDADDDTPDDAGRSAKASPSKADGSGEPPMSRDAAAAQVERYSSNNNKANQQRDPKLLDTVEDDALYKQSVAGMKADEGNPNAEEYEPFVYDVGLTEFHIPRFRDGDDRWFAALLYGEQDQKRKNPRLAVFAERPGPVQWEMVSAADLHTKPASVALDDEGYAEAVDQKTVAAATRNFRAGVKDHYVTGGEKEGKIFAPTKASEDQIRSHTELVSHLAPEGSTKFAGKTPEFTRTYSLRTDDGGVLTIFGTAHTQTDSVVRANHRITPSGDDQAWLGTTPRSAVTYTFECQNAVAADKTGKSARLLGYTCGKVDVKGPPA